MADLGDDLPAANRRTHYSPRFRFVPCLKKHGTRQGDDPEDKYEIVRVKERRL